MRWCAMADDLERAPPTNRLEAALHDEIDEEEALQEDARELVASMKPRLAKLVAQLDDDNDAMEALALLIEEALDGLTSRAVRLGYDSALRRSGLRQ